jgi:hydrogenase 3 maturation protease
VAVIGIGQELNGDDAVGVLVARRLVRWLNGSQQRLVIDAGLAPENCLGQLRQWRPDLVIVVDAALMDEPVGSARLLDWRAADGLRASTHTLPLNLVCRYLTETTGCEIALIGIQAADTSFGRRPSRSVNAAATRVAQALAELLHSPH